ncbi:transferase [Syncephalis fuscata]|nr:transferase [Syncephalis fuscata]
MTVVNKIEILVAPKNNHSNTTYHLSDTDYIPPPTHIQQVFFYKNHEQAADFMSTNTLVEGLQKAVEQYPMAAGRLACLENHDYVIQCTDKGVLYLESYCEDDISMFNPDWPQSSIRPEWQAASWNDAKDRPLIIRVTRFANNSGVVMCLSTHHNVADGHGWLMFMKSWAAFTRGESPLPPNHNREFLKLGLDLRHLLKKPLSSPDTQQYYAMWDSPRDTVLFRFSPEKLTQLKQMAIDSLSEKERNNGWFSTLDVVLVVVWRAAIRARQVPGETLLRDVAAFSMRKYLKGLPSNYFGNAVETSLFPMIASDVLNNSLGSVAMARRKAIAMTQKTSKDEWIVWANDDESESAINRESSWKSSIDIFTTDWSKFDYYAGMNFGYGNPTCCRRFTYPNGLVGTIFESPPCPQTGKSGFDICLGVDKNYYEQFIADSELFTYASLIV